MVEVTKDEIAEIILRYVKSEDELGFQLNGPWGSGKTYYVINEVMPRLKKAGYMPIYFSINGLSNIETIKQSLSKRILASYFKNKGDRYGLAERLDSGIGLVIDAGLSNKLFETLLKSGKKALKTLALANVDFPKTVLIIDDLERISGPLGIKEVFGYLATMLEERHCKVILISNEKKNENFNEIKSVKEKVINKSLEFNRIVSEVAEDIIKKNLEIIDKKYEAINDWIMYESKFLLSNVDDINLRTVKSVMSTYAELVEFVNKEEFADEQKKQMKKTGFLSIFVLTDCFKRNISLGDNYTNDLFGSSPNFFINSRFFKKMLNDNFGNSASKKNENNKTKTTELICEKFHAKSDEFDRNILYSVAIKNLIEHGFFDTETYTADIKQHFFHENSATQVTFQKLCNFRELSDNELENIQNDVSNSLDCSKNDIDYLLQVLKLFMFFNKKGLNLVNLKTDNLREGIRQRIAGMNKSEIEEIGFRISEGHLDNEDSLVKAFDSRKKDLRKEDDKDLFKSVLHCDWYGNDEFFKEQSFFKMLIDSNEVNKMVQAGQSSNIRNLRQYINAEGSQFVEDSNNTGELKYARKFAKELERLEPQVKGRVQLFNYQELEAIVNEVVQTADEKGDNNHVK